MLFSFKKKYCSILLPLVISMIFPFNQMDAQDTFSIVAVDTVTGEIGSAGASCVGAIFGVGAFILSDVIEGTGAIHTQAYYLPANQDNAHDRMLEGLSPQEIIDWLVANDAQGNPSIRQYGIVDLTRNGESAAFTGANCDDYKNHETGPGYSIQGNILMGQNIIDTMKYGFLNTPGPLADKLMYALENAKIVGADTRCFSRNTSSQSSFIKVVRIGDGDTPYLQEVVPDSPVNVDPIDLLRDKFDSWKALMMNTVDPFLSEAVFDTSLIPADGISQAILTITPKNNSDTLMASGLAILITNTGDGVVGQVNDPGTGEYEAIITSPTIEGIDTFNIKIVSGVDTVALAVKPVIEYFDVTSVNEETGLPGRFILYQNFPNPFNPSTEIKYRLLESGVVTIVIYNPVGEKIKTLIDQYQASGEHNLLWDGNDERNRQAPGGIYFYQVTSGMISVTKKMIKLQ